VLCTLPRTIQCADARCARETATVQLRNHPAHVRCCRMALTCKSGQVCRLKTAGRLFNPEDNSTLAGQRGINQLLSRDHICESLYKGSAFHGQSFNQGPPEPRKVRILNVRLL
jgi:hypothetical protein